MKMQFHAIRLAAMQFGDLDPRDHACFLYRRLFRSLFGCTQSHVRQLWNTIDEEIQELPYNHIGWCLATLYFLRCNPTMDQLAGLIRKNPVTLRKHVWEFVAHFAALEMVRDHRRYPWLSWTDPADIVQLSVRRQIEHVRLMTAHPELLVARPDPPRGTHPIVLDVSSDISTTDDDDDDSTVHGTTITATTAPPLPLTQPSPDQVGE